MFVNIGRVSSVIKVLIREHDLQYSNISGASDHPCPGGMTLICTWQHFRPSVRVVKRANGPRLPESRT